MISVTILTAVLFAFLFGSSMYSARNLQSMAYQIPEFGFVALAMMLSFMIGGIDLSIIANANTSGIFAALILTGVWFPGLDEHSAIIAAVLVAMGSSILFGFFNGWMVSKLSAPSLIATLGTMTLYSGIGMALTGGKGVTGLPPSFASFGTAELGGVPLIFIVFALAAVIFSVILNDTAFGRKIYLYGGNRIAARFSAISNERMSIGIFVMGLNYLSDRRAEKVRVDLFRNRTPQA